MRYAVAVAGAFLGSALLLGAAEKIAPEKVTGEKVTAEKVAGEKVTAEKVAARPAPVHPDIPALEKAVVDTTVAFVHDDCRAAREALDRLDRGCRRLSKEDNPKAPDELIEYDQAFHKTVDLSREFATAERVEKAFDQFAWAQRACRICHGLARKEGLMAEAPAPPKPAP